MFEEDFERCFICQTACKGLYCSSECRTQDRGSTDRVPKVAPIHLTSQLPIALSPRFRPHAAIQPSPRMPPHGRASSSSSSSITSSPLQSPSTNPTGSDSPQKEPFDLPPPAFPNSHIHFSGSVPVKIPQLAARPAPTPPPVPSHGTAYHGTSIDTLRFGRKPSMVNSVTSPNALIARCACGKPANHSRATSKDRSGGESDFSRLTLGPSVLAPRVDKRITSESSIRPASGHGTPQTELNTLGFGASLLSRSRSDPMHPKFYEHRGVPPVQAGRSGSVIAPGGRRASHAAEGSGRSGYAHALLMNRTTSSDLQPEIPAPTAATAPTPNSADRGRSRERMRHPVEPQPGHLLNHPPEREVAPSRSRHRREERERERDRTRRDMPSPTLLPVEAAPIMPSWARPIGADDGIAPSPLRGGRRSPKKVSHEDR